MFKIRFYAVFQTVAKKVDAGPKGIAVRRMSPDPSIYSLIHCKLAAHITENDTPLTVLALRGNMGERLLRRQP